MEGANQQLSSMIRRDGHLGTVIFSTSAKYILDVLFCIAFTRHCETLVKLNRDYEKIGRSSLWQLTEDFIDRI